MLQDILTLAQRKAVAYHPRHFGSPITVAGKEIDSEIDEIISKEKDDLSRRGWSEDDVAKIIDHSINWVVGWTTKVAGISKYQLTGDDLIGPFRAQFPNAVRKAEKWRRTRPHSPYPEDELWFRYGQMCALITEAGGVCPDLTEDMADWLARR